MKTLTRLLDRAWPGKRWRGWSLPAKATYVALVLTVVGLAIVTAQYFNHWIAEQSADPKPHTSVKISSSEIYIQLRTHSTANSVSIDFPVLGRIVSIHDYNVPADASSVSKRILGHNTAISQNNVEIVLSDVKPDRDLSIRILYEPMPVDAVAIAGTDRWELSYTWLFDGMAHSRTKWLLKANGREVAAPPLFVRGFTIVPRVLSPEEIRKKYEKGPPRQAQ